MLLRVHLRDFESDCRRSVDLENCLCISVCIVIISINQCKLFVTAMVE